MEKLSSLLTNNFISSMVDLGNGLILAAEYEIENYQRLDLKNEGSSTLVLPAFSKPICIKKMPFFDYEHFPYILCKEE